MVHSNGHSSNGREIKIARPIAENLHPVANPALDLEGSIYVTFSGSRGQKVIPARGDLAEFKLTERIPALGNAVPLVFIPNRSLLAYAAPTSPEPAPPPESA